MPKIRGFTLVELMIAITIVAMLAALGLTAYTGAQKSGRDVRRRAEVDTLASAIEAKKDTTTSIYILTATDIANEFPSGSTAALGTDPLGNPYCIVTSAGSGPNALVDPTTGGGSASASCSWYSNSANLATIAAQITSGGLGSTNGNVKSWVLCAQLEGSVRPYCRDSSSLH